MIGSAILDQDPDREERMAVPLTLAMTMDEYAAQTQLKPQPEHISWSSRFYVAHAWSSWHILYDGARYQYLNVYAGSVNQKLVQS